MITTKQINGDGHILTCSKRGQRKNSKNALNTYYKFQINVWHQITGSNQGEGTKKGGKKGTTQHDLTRAKNWKHTIVQTILIRDYLNEKTVPSAPFTFRAK